MKLLRNKFPVKINVSLDVCMIANGSALMFFFQIYVSNVSYAIFLPSKDILEGGGSSIKESPHSK